LATQKHRPSTPGRTSMSGPTQTLYYRVRRCSRPLCSSQRTTSHRPHAPAGPATPRGDGGTRNRTALNRDRRHPRRDGPLPQDPTACLPPRTSKRLRSTPRGAVLGAGRWPAAELVSVPPSSTTPHAPPAVRR